MMLSLLRPLAIVASLISMSACMEVTPVSKATASRITVLAGAVDIIALRNEFFASNPSEDKFDLMHREGGFEIYRDGRILSVAPTSTRRRAVPTSVESNDNRILCLAPENGWSGACLTVVEIPDGALELSYANGNGFRDTYRVLSVGRTNGVLTPR